MYMYDRIQRTARITAVDYLAWKLNDLSSAMKQGFFELFPKETIGVELQSRPKLGDRMSSPPLTLCTWSKHHRA